MSGAFRVVDRETVLQCFAFSVESRRVSDGVVSFDRDVVVHPGAVAMLAVRDDGAVGLLRQYRATFDDVNWELPAGTLDVAGEPPHAAAARELEEELGCRAGSLRELFRYMNSRGWTDQQTIVFHATELAFFERRPSGPEENNAEIHWLGVPALRALLARGELMESSTLMALLWYLGQGSA